MADGGPGTGRLLTRAILALHYEAIETMRMTGTVTLTEGLDAPIVISAKRRPRSYRLEFEYEREPNISAYAGAA